MIKTERGSIWAYEKTHDLVIPTNIGWKEKDRCNVMGRGLALQAANKYTGFAFWFGTECAVRRENTPVLPYPNGPLIAFPVKPLNPVAPWMSWKNKADLKLIERSAKQLAELKTDRPVAVSMVGCGNGGLDMADVRPILDRHLSSDKFTLILYGGEAC